MSILDRLRRRHRRPLRALQVEVTSRCARRCAVCPRSSLAEARRDGDLDDALWKVVAADLELTEHVQLQGWGEPLLHPLLPAWARDARAAGCTVGLTTNGDLLEEAASWLLEGDVDRVVVSVAGNADNHAALRDGSQLESVLAAAGNLARRARERRVPLRILISYLLTRNNAADLPAVVRLAARARVDELFVTHLDCPTSPALVEQAAFSGDVLIEGVKAHLKEAEMVASDSGIGFRDQTQGGEEQLVCSLDPLRIVFVGWDGRVGPCVNLLLPVEGPIPRWSANGCTEGYPYALRGSMDSAPRGGEAFPGLGPRALRHRAPGVGQGRHDKDHRPERQPLSRRLHTLSQGTWVVGFNGSLHLSR